ncbi:C-type lectin domain family 2 member L isoform X3 [Dermochelys coriacea]|uniref:C-type lectin domain family 2 member L isoform X3 n=1 Tax=Dermochelys coriacea TaxID=27794 RepID=UPI001CA903CB|nr:C-type lectin domain family 2 member L isoform X3 [Dermochelys coriacea]
MRRSRGDAVIGGGSPPASPGCLPGLCSNIWFWRCTTGILAVVAVLILCIHLAVNCSSAKGSSGCPPPEPCPADWLYHQGKCYYFSEKEKDWNSSQSFCSSHNSSLTVIESQQELSRSVTRYSAQKNMKIRTAILGQTKGPSSPVSCLPTMANARCPRGNEQNRNL